MSIHSDINEEFVVGGQPVQISEQNDISVAVIATPDKDTVRYTVDITNYRNEPVFLDVDAIEVQQGRSELHHWKPLATYSAIGYAKRLKSINTFNQIVYGVAAGISSASAFYSTSYTTGYGYGAYTTTYNPSAGYASSGSYLLMADIDDYLSKDHARSIDRAYLKSSQIIPGSNQIGLFFTKDGSQPDYKLIVPIEDEVFEFQFRRSDYKEVLNPWLDRSKPRHSLLFSYTPRSPRLGFYYKYSDDAAWGWYFGATLASNNDWPTFDLWATTSSYDGGQTLLRPNAWTQDPDPSDSLRSPSDYDWFFDHKKGSDFFNEYFSMYVGFTRKLIPYTWLLGGIGFGVHDGEYYQGTVFYKPKGADSSEYKSYGSGWIYNSYDSMLLIVPQFGFGWIFNNIDLTLFASVPFADFTKSKFYVEFLVGFAI
ncbi:MAG TPA: hypothetical protein PLI69_06620 [Bacteroidales bacterium]|nr:hypothetical protein [Bacteroidales bacterium]